MVAAVATLAEKPEINRRGICARIVTANTDDLSAVCSD